MKYQIRIDPKGNGHWWAPRGGGRRHKGVDLVWIPDEPVPAFWAGEVVRVRYPYQGDFHYKGLLIRGAAVHYTIFYVDFDPSIVGKVLKAGDHLGYAQRISKKYGPTMIDHIHLQIDSVDPQILLEMEGVYGSLKRIF